MVCFSLRGKFSKGVNCYVSSESWLICIIVEEFLCIMVCCFGVVLCLNVGIILEFLVFFVFMV